MHCACHTAGSRCIHAQSWCKSSYEVFGSPWAQYAHWRLWNHRHWEQQRLRKEGNARINEMSAMRPCLAKIIEKVRISRYFEWPETDHHIAENACHIDYADNRSSKPVHYLSTSPRLHPSTTFYGYEDTLELDTAVRWVSILITRIHPSVAPKSNIQWLPATLHSTGGMDDYAVRHGSFEAIRLLDPVDVEQAYSHIASRPNSLQWHIRSYGWRCASFN